MLQCNICGKEFETGQKLGGHISNMHSLQRLHTQETLKKRAENVKIFDKICPKCGVIFEVKRKEKDGEYVAVSRERTFCSSRCANSRQHTEKEKEKISKSLFKPELRIKCESCGKEIRINPSRLCRSCINRSDKMRKKNSEAQLRLVKEGKHHGWPSRKIESYAETFFKRVLTNNGFIENKDYFFNHTVKKVDLGVESSSCYFLDFFFPNKMLDLEIDGGQHFYYEERIESDTLRDNLLKEHQYDVYRITWKNINTEKGRAYVF
jgi:Protein of unknown function (DUF559)